MKNPIKFTILLLLTKASFAQNSVNCSDYYTVGNTWSAHQPVTHCSDDFVYENVYGDTIPWTHIACDGQLVTTSLVGAVSCMNIIYGKVNTDDYGLLTTDTGGQLTIEVVNSNVNGDTIGPYTCPNQSYGDVAVLVCSDIPFNVLTLTNTGCSSGWVSGCGTGVFTSGLEKNNESILLNIFPNPTSEILNIKSSTDLNEAGYEIYNVSGVLVLEGSIGAQKNNIDVSKIPPGTYLLRLRNEDFSSTKKFTIL